MRKATYLFFAVLMLYSGCTKDQAAYNEDCDKCAVEISFKADIIPILQTECAVADCHDNIAQEGGLVLDSTVAYHNLTLNGTGYIYTDSAQLKDGILYTYIEPGSIDPMPPLPEPKLDQCSFNRIKCWILQGAKDN